MDLGSSRLPSKGVGYFQMGMLEGLGRYTGQRSGVGVVRALTGHQGSVAPACAHLANIITGMQWFRTVH